MPLEIPVIIEDFSGGLNTDKDAAQLAINEASIAQDVDLRDQILKKLPGQDNRFASLPASFTPISIGEGLFVEPTAVASGSGLTVGPQKVLIAYGTVSGADRLYVRPYVNLSGEWVDDWLNLTEFEGTEGTPLTMDAGSGTTTIVDSALSNATDDYYNQWIVWNTTRNYSSLVTDYVGSTKTLTLKQVVVGQTTGDSYWLIRFPIRDPAGNDLFNPDGECRFRFRRNVIEILTGNDDGHSVKSDFWLGYINQTFFDDSDFNFTSMFFTRNNLDQLQAQSTSSNWATDDIAEGTDPLDDDDYILVIVPKYDGFQEGSFYGGNTVDGIPNGTLYNVFHGVLLSSDRIDVTFKMSFNHEQLILPNPIVEVGGPTSHDKAHIMWDKRITSLLLYLAKADQVSSGVTWVPTESFRMVREIPIDDGSWNLGSADGSGRKKYEQTVEIKGNDYTQAEGQTRSSRAGHDDLRVDANAKFSANVGDRVYWLSTHTAKEEKKSIPGGGTFAGNRRDDRIIRSAVNSFGINTPDVKPQGQSIDTSAYGIPRILGVVEALGRIIVFGENKILRILDDGITPIIEETFIERGGISDRGFVSANNFVYFTALDNIYILNPVQGQPAAISENRIRDEWQAFTVAQRQAAVLGYDRNRNCVIVCVSTTCYIWWINRSAWITFTGFTSQVNWLTTGYDGEAIAITADGEIADVFGSSPDQNTQLKWQTGAFPGPLRNERLLVTFKGTDRMVAKVYDANKGLANQRLKDVIFTTPGTNTKRLSREASVDLGRLQVLFQSDASKNSDNEVERLELDVKPLQKK